MARRGRQRLRDRSAAAEGGGAADRGPSPKDSEERDLISNRESDKGTKRGTERTQGRTKACRSRGKRPQSPQGCSGQEAPRGTQALPEERLTGRGDRPWSHLSPPSCLPCFHCTLVLRLVVFLPVLALGFFPWVLDPARSPEQAAERDGGGREARLVRWPRLWSRRAPAAVAPLGAFFLSVFLFFCFFFFSFFVDNRRPGSRGSRRVCAWHKLRNTSLRRAIEFDYLREGVKLSHVRRACSAPWTGYLERPKAGSLGLFWVTFFTRLECKTST